MKETVLRILQAHPIALALAALILLAAPPAAAMTFETITGPDACAARACILANGDIDKDSGDQFATFLRTNKIGAGGLVVLNSQGGHLLQSLTLGNAIRKAGLSTTVALFDRATGRFRTGGRCASACAYAFLGGVQRYVELGAKIGVHQVFNLGDSSSLSASDGQWLMSMVAAHVNHLCGRLDVLIPALRTRPDDMYWLTTRELRQDAVITTASAAA
ncbi:MAG: hypothetical protein JWP50_722 [Phenylobacterium sp.]|nr:hypothetical protein [Phenylobacterium sp.]